jgi:hypothetical protein
LLAFCLIEIKESLNKIKSKEKFSLFQKRIKSNDVSFIWFINLA